MGALKLKNVFYSIHIIHIRLQYNITPFGEGFVIHHYFNGIKLILMNIVPIVCRLLKINYSFN